MPIEEIVAGRRQPNSDNDIDLKVYDRNGDPVRATKLFHSGEHPTLRMRTCEGYELTGTPNHPVLCLVSVAGVPTLLWKLLAEIASRRPGRACSGSQPSEFGVPRAGPSSRRPSVAAALVSDGWAADGRAGFNTVDREYFVRVLAAYDAAVGGDRSARGAARHLTVAPLHEMDVGDLTLAARQRSRPS